MDVMTRAALIVADGSHSLLWLVPSVFLVLILAWIAEDLLSDYGLA